MKPVKPTCPTCGRELVLVASGAVCIEGHGRITPLGEYEAENRRPVTVRGLERVTTERMDVRCARIEKAYKRLAQLHAADAADRLKR